jgi:hypothetical protein
MTNRDLIPISTIWLKDETGEVRYTFSQTTLHAGKQTRGHCHNGTDEIYKFSHVGNTGVKLPILVDPVERD